MMPPDGPLPNSPITWASHAPLSRWEIDEVFDTAAECKTAEHKLEEHARWMWNTQRLLGKDESEGEKKRFF